MSSLVSALWIIILFATNCILRMKCRMVLPSCIHNDINSRRYDYPLIWGRSLCEKHYGVDECDRMDPRRRYVDHYHQKSLHPVFLFVVNYHWSLFKSIDFFRNEYYPRFHQLFNYSFDVVYLAPTHEKNCTIASHGLPKGGFYSYHTLSVAYYLYGNVSGYSYDGYFLVNDDAFLDPLLLNQQNLSHSFHERTGVYNRESNWHWNKASNEFLVSFPDAFYAAIEDVKRIPLLEEKCNLKNPANHRWMLQDFFYVVGDDVETFAALSVVFYKHRAFLEMAGPTINWCLSHHFIASCNHGFWRDVRDCVHFHPVKLGNSSNRELVMNHINRVDMERVPSMPWLLLCCT